MGGEEFVALLAGSNVVAARDYAERVRPSFASGADGAGRVTISAGVAAAVAPESIDSLIQTADSALYSAKRAGRDRIVVEPVPPVAA